MPEESFEERTEAPSEKRRQEAREKGTVAKSTEINSVLVLLAGILLLQMLGPWIYRELESVCRDTFMLIGTYGGSDASLVSLMRQSVITLGRIVLPVVASIMVIGIVANFVQIGFLFTLKPLMPKLEKIDPISGTKRMFSLRSLVEMVKSILKLTVIGVVAYLSIKAEYHKFLVLADTSVQAIWVFLLQTGFNIILKIALALIVLAILDYAFQRYEHEKKLRMTRQEVKEERKQMEGDPQVKSRVRSLQREMARRRMMEEVPRATVVVTNPTYIAIGIRYEPSEMDTPVVVAKGKRLIAERIKATAAEHHIPIVEDKPLARAMYDKVEVGFEVPMEFFTAVAEILAYVYRLKHKAAA